MIETVSGYMERNYGWAVTSDVPAMHALRLAGLEPPDFADRRTEFVCDCMYRARAALPSTMKLLKDCAEGPKAADMSKEDVIKAQEAVKRKMAEHCLEDVWRIYASRDMQTGYDLKRAAGLATILAYFITDMVNQEANQDTGNR